ncbi:unnamed protein product [Scytosiphon promiscuus]
MGVMDRQIRRKRGFASVSPSSARFLVIPVGFFLLLSEPAMAGASGATSAAVPSPSPTPSMAGPTPSMAGVVTSLSPTAAQFAPEATPAPRETPQPKLPTPSVPPVPLGEVVPAEEDSSDDDYSLVSIVGASVVGAFLLAVLVVTCFGLRSHCADKGKSIRHSLEELVAKGSFWGAILVLFGLMIALNAYAISVLWTAVSVFGTVVMCFGIVAWFIAFQTGTPAVISLELPRRSAPTSVRGDSEEGGTGDGSGGGGDGGGGGGGGGASRRSITSNSTCDTPRGCSFAASPSGTDLPRWLNGKGSGQSATTASTAVPSTPARNAADTFFPDTFVRAVYIPAHSVDGLQP